jgi:hypothetical protein
MIGSSSKTVSSRRQPTTLVKNRSQSGIVIAHIAVTAMIRVTLFILLRILFALNGTARKRSTL